MSTRSQIGFYKERNSKLKSWEALIYRHSDGYPEGVLPDIIPFLRWWKGSRGISDLEYCSARLLQYLCNQYDGTDIVNKDYTGTLGHGICNQFHGDIEYFYFVYPNGVKVYDVPFINKIDAELFLFIKDINLDERVDMDKILAEIAGHKASI